MNNLSPLCQHSAILENIHWTQTVYAVLCQLHHTALCWCRGDELLNKVIILFFLCIQKVFSLFCKIMVEPLMADGLFWQCLSYYSGPWQCYLLGSQWDSHKHPDFHPKYLKLCFPKTNKAFTGLEQQVINDNIFILGRGNPLTINLVVCSNYISRGVHHSYGWRMNLMETYIGHTSYQK